MRWAQAPSPFKAEIETVIARQRPRRAWGGNELNRYCNMANAVLLSWSIIGFSVPVMAEDVNSKEYGSLSNKCKVSTSIDPFTDKVKYHHLSCGNDKFHVVCGGGYSQLLFETEESKSCDPDASVEIKYRWAKRTPQEFQGECISNTSARKFGEEIAKDFMNEMDNAAKEIRERGKALVQYHYLFFKVGSAIEKVELYALPSLGAVSEFKSRCGW